MEAHAWCINNYLIFGSKIIPFEVMIINTIQALRMKKLKIKIIYLLVRHDFEVSELLGFLNMYVIPRMHCLFLNNFEQSLLNVQNGYFIFKIENLFREGLPRNFLCMSFPHILLTEGSKITQIK